MAKRKAKAPATDAAQQDAAQAAHDQQLAENPVTHPLPAAPAPDIFDEVISAREAGQFEQPASPSAEAPATHPEPVATDTNVGHTAALPPEEATAIHAEVKHALSHAQREQSRRADPFRLHAVHFPDGYRIAVQESDSRRTMEIQFGDGSRASQPKNFGPIKEVLRSAGMKWNGANAWVIDLIPERGSFHQREDAKTRNKAIRTMVEEQVFPQVIGLEEAARGPVELTEGFRQRIEGR